MINSTLKFLFLDYRQIESQTGFTRKLDRPRKHSVEPLLDSVQLWGSDYMTVYGSVVRRPDDGLWQLWYTTEVPRMGIVLAYAESTDGIAWTRPELDLVRVRGKKTNIVMARQAHGATVFYDDADARPGWRYKMLAGAAPSNRICAFRSPDGILWSPSAENPVIGTSPDCPMSLTRLADGRYVAYHRPAFGDRRVGRTESHDFRHFSRAEVVMEPDAQDPPNTQFYGMGSALYGGYLIGTLWVYHTDENDLGFHKMRGFQQPEFVHSRGGVCWHRTDHGTPWIRVENETGRFDSGQVQPVSSPVFLDDEIRFYYVGTRYRHGKGERWAGKGPGAGLGFASCKPDRFVSLRATGTGRLLTRPFWTTTPEIFMNAIVGRRGQLRVEVQDVAGSPIKGFELDKCRPATGNDGAHRMTWNGDADPSALMNREIRLRVHCRNTTLYSISIGPEKRIHHYRDFRISGFLGMALEKERPWAVG